MYTYAFQKYFTKSDSESYVIDKRKSIDSYKGYMLSRLSKMFHYSNLPKTIPQYILELYLMTNGSCLVAEVESKLYAFKGSFGGEPDPYLRPTLYIVANPALNFDKSFTISNNEIESEDCVLMRNDILLQGLNPLISRYATLLAENTITMRTADIMLRIVALITSPDDKTKQAADIYIKNIIDGKLTTLAENRFFDGVKMQNPPSNNGSYLTQFIELHQYLMGQFYNEIGIQSAFNMKREALNESETRLSQDTLFPLVESMLECRQEDVSQLNNMFGTDIEVVFDSVWRQNIIEQALELKSIEIAGTNVNVDNKVVDSDNEVDSNEVDSSEVDSSEVDSNEVEDNNVIENVLNDVVEDMLSEVEVNTDNEFENLGNNIESTNTRVS